MPSRVAHSSLPTASLTSASRSKTKKSNKRSLNAFAEASHATSDRPKIPHHRLGDVPEESRQKRRRLQDDEESEEDDEHATNKHSLQQKRVKKSTNRHGGALGGDEVETGSDSEGNDWMMGELGEDDDDSDIDSDEAFNSDSDVERFDGFTFRGSKSGSGARKMRGKNRAVEVDMLDDRADEELEDSEDEDFGDDGVDLATMLDESQSEDEPSDSKTKAAQRIDSEDEDTDEDDGSSDAASDSPSDTPPSELEDSDEDDPDKLSNLQDLIFSLPSGPSKKKSVRAADLNESRPPTAYPSSSRKEELDDEDIFGVSNDPGARKALKKANRSNAAKGSNAPDVVRAPLPPRQQAKVDRTIASQKAKETLDRWQDTVIQNRRADFLQFPLVDPNAQEPLGASKLVPTQQSKPRTELETAIQGILVESGLVSAKGTDEEEKKLHAFEELAANKLPLEEVLARRAELRRARELLFREEAKAKRIKKIKSKSYRRVHRKERERQAISDRGIEGLGSDDVEEREKQDRRRAEERMGAKHRESRWAKSVRASGRAVWDEDARAGVTEMARRNEELRRRIDGRTAHAVTESDVSAVSSDASDDDGGSVDDDVAERKRLAKQLNRLSADGGDEQSKLGSMKFMQRAEAAKKARNDEDIERMRKDLAKEDGDESSSAEEEVERAGRKTFGPKPTAMVRTASKQARDVLEEGDASGDETRNDEEEAEIIVNDDVSKTTATVKPKSILKNGTRRPLQHTESAEEEEDNVWTRMKTMSKSSKARSLASDMPLLDLSKPVQEVSGVYDSPTPATPESSVKKHSLGTTAARPQMKPAKSVTVSSAPHKNGVGTTVSSTNGAAKTASAPAFNSDSDFDSDSATEPPPQILPRNSDKTALYQRAFAGDDTTAAFEAEKAETIKVDDDKITSTHLPGWGSWTGEGLSKATRRHNHALAANPLRQILTPGVAPDKRKDAKLDRVIMNEGQQRKNKKYLASQLPHEFERREQYERSLRLPVGPEWTTKETFQRMTRPRVVVKQGVVEAMERPLV
ncbi:hypothetical protein LTR50_004712 [Elasticomyces elasticus]|nr:hypothetical protein LTR50_004712 [Elasticomyces elasticus]